MKNKKETIIDLLKHIYALNEFIINFKKVIPELKLEDIDFDIQGIKFGYIVEFNKYYLNYKDGDNIDGIDSKDVDEIIEFVEKHLGEK